MDFVAVVDQAIALLRQRGRLMYRTLQVQLQLDTEHLAVLTEARIEGQHRAVDAAGRVLVWNGASGATASPAAPSSLEPLPQAPLAYTPPSLAEKMLTARSALAGERTQVTLLCADLKGSMERLADRDPAEARPRLDPVLARMIAAVHRLPHAPLQGGIRDLGGGRRPPTISPHGCRRRYQCPLSIQRWCERPVRPICGARLPSRLGWITSPLDVSMAPRTVGAATKTCVPSACVVSRRTSWVRAGRRGNYARASRVTQRAQAQLPTPVQACHSPTVTTVRGQRCASGGVGMSPICASTSENTAVSNSTVCLPRSLYGQADTCPAWTRRMTTARPNNVLYACAQFSRHGVVCQRRTPGVQKEGQAWLQVRNPHGLAPASSGKKTPASSPALGNIPGTCSSAA